MATHPLLGLASGMQVLLFGATGMVGQGVLRECLRDARVDRVVAVGRSQVAQTDPKLVQIGLADLAAIDSIAGQLTGFDACMFCAGVSSAGMSEQHYTALTFDLTLTVARTLAPLNPAMTFLYVSGAGTDSTGLSRWMWARVKGRTEAALARLPFKAAYMLRPGFIQPLHGVRSKTGWVRWVYAALAPVSPLLLRLFPGAVTTTERVGRAMIAVALFGHDTQVMESADINLFV